MIRFKSLNLFLLLMLSFTSVSQASVIIENFQTPDVKGAEEILFKGMRDTAKQSLSGKKQCRKSSQCKRITTNWCGSNFLIYSTYRNNTIETAMTAMQQAKLKVETNGYTCPGAPVFPVTMQCQNSQCIEVTENPWSERVFPQ